MGKVEATKAKRKKSKRRLRRQIRKTLAAVFMITAIVVAAIPVDNITAAGEENTVVDTTESALGTTTSVAYEYPTDITPYKISPPSGVNLNFEDVKQIQPDVETGTTYYMIYDSANSIYQMQWRYHYYVVQIGSNSYGVIYDYNNINPVDSLLISSKETAHYVTVGNSEYESFKQNCKVNPVTYKYTYEDYLAKRVNEASRMISKYRSQQWNTFQSACYAAVNNGAAQPSDIVLASSDLDNEELLSYYCEMTSVEFGQTTKKLTGCTLTSIYDLTKPAVDGKYELAYVVQRVGTTESGVTYETETDFVYNSSVSIVGIGEKAFKDVQNVASYTIETGVTYIGDNSFEGSSAKSINFQFGVQYIGNQSFKNCQMLNAVTFADDNINIGAEAFYGTAITSLTMPTLLRSIGVGAFASCASLTEVDFSKINYYDSASENGCVIEQGAFYNDYALNELKFFNGSTSATITSIGDGCFAVDHSVSSALNQINLPSTISKSEGLGAKLFYNRNNLKKIVMPSEFGYLTDVSINNDFLAGVVNLEELEFLESSSKVSYNTNNRGDLNSTTNLYENYALFRDIINDQFIVRGPARDSITYLTAKVRSNTWSAYFNHFSKTPIPYVYKNEEGKDVYEIATGEGNAYIMSINDKGELSNCEINPFSGMASDAIVDFTIPSKVGKYTITSISSGCFENFKYNIGTLTISDDSVQTLEANSFEGCPNLTTVYIGDGITQIGAKTFYNCPKLEHVYFRTPDCGYEAFEIGTDAFQTLSDRLTFHGDIDKNYDAFEYAMAAENWVDNSVSTNLISICYKSDYVKNSKPGFLTVLKERYQDGSDEIKTRATLVDYLHYEELPTLPVSLLEEPFGITSTWPEIMFNYESGAGVTPKEEEIIDSTINIVIPSGIESIDVKTFLSSGLNSGNVSAYLHNSLGYTTDSTLDNYYLKYEYATKPEFALTGIVKYNIRLDNYSRVTEPSNDTGGSYARGTMITITPYEQTVTDYDPGMSVSGWEMYGWKASCSDSTFALGSAAYEKENLNFVMPSGDVSVKTVYAPVITRSIDQYQASGSLNTRVTTETSLYSSENDITYQFDYWTINVYNDANHSSEILQSDYSQALSGFDKNSPSMDMTVKPGYVVILTAHYYVPNMGSASVAFRNSGITNYSASSKKVSSKIYPDYYYNYLDYGLFNGFYGYENSNDAYVYSAREYSSTEGNSHLETVDIGNDRILSVVMNTVKAVPDYAFNSCENLKRIDLGSSIESIGSAAFTGCDKLTELSSSGNYVSQNGVLYYKNDDDTYKIIECLTSRGNGVGSKNYPDENDIDVSLITEIASGAFEGCNHLSTVDLAKATNLTVIPTNAFMNCGSLQKVFLPRTITTIETGAFVDTNNCYVTIPTLVLEIQDYAFSAGTTIRSYKDGSGYYYTNKFKDVFFEAIDVNYTVDFVDWDGTKLCETQYIEPGKNAVPPENPTREGYVFKEWKGSYIGIEKDTLVVATYEQIVEEVKPDATYTLDVDMGYGDGTYTAGTKVVITAYDPFDGYEFDKWTSTSTDLSIVDSNVYLTTITMPAHNVEIKATYKKKTTSDSGNNNNNSSNNGQGSLSNNNNNNNNGSGSLSGNNNGSSGGNNGNSSTNKPGTIVDINKPGISNGGSSSAIVNGSTDNFIVKITDSAAATEAVRQALINEYGSLENIAYMAMDISLYDSTGTTKITDTKGLSVTITIPIPDSLIPYSGNNKAAGVVDSANGYVLDKLGVKFSTIDGVSCITFTATHFSPYTLYVDKKNASYNENLDDTPKTGDGIHPKWFLSIGLAALSVFLFFKKDRTSGKKVRLV